MRLAAWIPNVDPFGDPLLLTDLAVAAEDGGYHRPRSRWAQYAQRSLTAVA
jgi:hypothetical protein